MFVYNDPDNCGPNEQQKPAQPEIQHQATPTGNFQPGMATPVGYMMSPGHLETGHAVVQFLELFVEAFFFFFFTFERT